MNLTLLKLCNLANNCGKSLANTPSIPCVFSLFFIRIAVLQKDSLHKSTALIVQLIYNFIPLKVCDLANSCGKSLGNPQRVPCFLPCSSSKLLCSEAVLFVNYLPVGRLLLEKNSIELKRANNCEKSLFLVLERAFLCIFVSL